MQSIDHGVQSEIDALFWFHSFDFPGGLKASGFKSLDIVDREAAAYFDGIDLTGRSVLDIGTWNGFMAFAAEQRGAERVVGSDRIAWDVGWASGRRPFDLARQLLGSAIEPMEIDVPDITPETVGRFDVVLFLGVFYHLLDAAALTQRIAAVAGDLLILETWQDALDNPRPAMIFYPGAALNNDASNWWGPNPHRVYEILTECGFARIFYQDNPNNPTDRADAAFRSRGIFHAFRDDVAVARLKARGNGWHDLSVASVRDNIFAPL